MPGPRPSQTITEALPWASSTLPSSLQTLSSWNTVSPPPCHLGLTGHVLQAPSEPLASPALLVPRVDQALAVASHAPGRDVMRGHPVE